MADMKRFEFFKNTGGLNLRFNEMLIDSDEAETIVNLHATSTGSWSSKGIGYQTLNAIPIGSGAVIQQIYDYVDLTGQQYMVVAAGSEIYEMESGNGSVTSIGSGFNENGNFDFMTFKGLLIGCNGKEVPQKWDGTNTFESLEGWPPEIAGVTIGHPAFGEVFSNRVVFAGDSENPSMLYISELENPENFTPDTGATSAGAIQVSPGDGESITGLKTLFLPVENEEVLVVFKDNSTYVLSGKDANSFTLQKISDEFGVVNNRSIVLIGNELIFLSKEGVTSLSTATVQGNIITGFLSDKIRKLINNMNTNKLEECYVIHLRNRQEVWWCIPSGSSTKNQTILVMNYALSNAWSVREGIVSSCGSVINGKLYTGTYDGKVNQQLQGNTYNGEAIQWRYKTPYYDLSSPHVRKRINNIDLFFKQISQTDITVLSSWDFKRNIQEREERVLSIPPAILSTEYDSATYGTDYFNITGTSVLKMIPSGSGKFFQLEFSGSDVNKPVEIEGWTMSAIYGGQR